MVIVCRTLDWPGFKTRTEYCSTQSHLDGSRKDFRQLDLVLEVEADELKGLQFGAGYEQASLIIGAPNDENNLASISPLYPFPFSTFPPRSLLLLLRHRRRHPTLMPLEHLLLRHKRPIHSNISLLAISITKLWRHSLEPGPDVFRLESNSVNYVAVSSETAHYTVWTELRSAQFILFESSDAPG